MTPDETVTTGYERWNAGDFEGLLTLFTDDATFAVPGETSVSGDHDKAGFRAVLEKVAEASKAGRHRQEVICRYAGDSGIVVLFDNYVGEGAAQKYHSVHEWIFRDGRPFAWMLYVHEYDIFADAWR